jgi:hypothetical protein
MIGHSGLPFPSQAVAMRAFAISFRCLARSLSSATCRRAMALTCGRSGGGPTIGGVGRGSAREKLRSRARLMNRRRWMSAEPWARAWGTTVFVRGTVPIDKQTAIGLRPPLHPTGCEGE